MDARLAQLARSIAQEQVRKLVGRELAGQFTKRSQLTPVEEALVRAYYNPDRRLG